MSLFIGSLVVIVFAGLGMAVGVLAGRKPLCSGCVGLARLDTSQPSACVACRASETERDEQ